MLEGETSATEVVGGTGAIDGTEPVADAAVEAAGRTNWFFYGLGLSLQTFLWFLLFLALVVAIAVGGELTEFRYVGF
jgi:hypothetical protein